MNITLIGTLHSEIGKCNSDELYKIIDSIKPEVVFEELTNDFFDTFYGDKPITNEPPEVKCIKRYLQDNSIEHIPVDIIPNLDLSTDEIHYMFDTFKKYDAYKALENERDTLAEQEGFVYLNSKKFSELLDKMKLLERSLLQFEFNKVMLLRIYKLFHDEQSKREKAMLENIYNYSKRKKFNQAVFLIGCAHRNSMVQKIANYKAEEVKLNWAFY